MNNQAKKDLYAKIELDIHSDSSPVGIDAKKTHILILTKLEELHEELRLIKTHLNLD